jgi:superoxide reductase
MAVKINEIYQCRHCGIISEIIHPGMGEPVCCGAPMNRLEANHSDGKVEKHVPVVRHYGNICHVLVGSELHPMTAEHHIEWIKIRFNDTVIRKRLKPGENAEAEFCGIPEGAEVTARAYCNIHGLWISCKGCLS